MRVALFAVVAFLLVPVGTGATQEPKPKADFTLTVGQFAKEAKADGRAFRERYKNKVVELTGVVWMPRLQTGDVLLTAPDAKGADLAKLVSAGPPKFKLDESHRGLARGQAVTVRGEQVDNTYAALVDCEFVKVGPSTAIPATVSGLAAEFTKDDKAADAKYDNRSIVVRAKVLAAKNDGTRVRWTLGDPAGKGGATIEAVFDPLIDERPKVLEAVKPGDVVVLIGDVDSLRGTPCAISFPRLLKEPPAGVALPGEKK